MDKVKLKDGVKRIGTSILYWAWVKGSLYWLILSSGIIAEGAFLLASLWMSLNSSIHPFFLLFLSEDTTIHMSEIATAAYVGLPECILFLASVIVINHVQVYCYDKKNKVALVWAVLYGLPTLVFLVLSLFTLGSSVLSVHFHMPAPFIVARALAGYMFGFVSFLYWRLGTPQEADRLKQKDTFISELIEKARVLSLEIDALKAELEGQKRAIESEKAARKQMQEEMQRSDDEALQAYGDECIAWLRSGIKTASLDEITRFTGYSKRKIANAIASANLQVSPRNKELVLVSSLIQWLKNTPPPSGKTETETPVLHLVNE
jgi:hypothetical protein